MGGRDAQSKSGAAAAIPRLVFTHRAFPDHRWIAPCLEFARLNARNSFQSLFSHSDRRYRADAIIEDICRITTARQIIDALKAKRRMAQRPIGSRTASLEQIRQGMGHCTGTSKYPWISSHDWRGEHQSRATWAGEGEHSVSCGRGMAERNESIRARPPTAPATPARSAS